MLRLPVCLDLLFLTHESPLYSPSKKSASDHWADDYMQSWSAVRPLRGDRRPSRRIDQGPSPTRQGTARTAAGYNHQMNSGPSQVSLGGSPFCDSQISLQAGPVENLALFG
jgi:hypothetical protein